MAIVYDRWTLYIDKVTTDFLREFSSLTSHELNWKPNPDVWSIAQNIDHLIAINGPYFLLVHSLRTGEHKPPFLAKFKFVVDWAGQHILDSVYYDPIEKMKTFSVWESPSNGTDENIFDKLKRHQESLKQLVSGSYDLLEKQAVICSPNNRLMVYKLSTAYDAIVAQEKRHFKQAIDVLLLLQHKIATSVTFH